MIFNICRISFLSSMDKTNSSDAFPFPKNLSRLRFCTESWVDNFKMCNSSTSLFYQRIPVLSLPGRKCKNGDYFNSFRKNLLPCQNLILMLHEFCICTFMSSVFALSCVLHWSTFLLFPWIAALSEDKPKLKLTWSNCYPLEQEVFH